MTARTFLAAAPVAIGDLDAALVGLGSAQIERRKGELLLECAEDVAGKAIVLLARAGARATFTNTLPDRAASLVPAIVRDLEPRGAAVADRITVRAVETGEAVAQLLRRHWLRARPSSARTDALRRVLRGEDHLYAWRRVIWATPLQLRSREMHDVTPVVFDRDAVTGAAERFAFSREGRLTRWARP